MKIPPEDTQNPFAPSKLATGPQYKQTGTHASITSWPKSDRPREKLLALGANELTDAELLAVFLRTGRPGFTAVDLARQLFKHLGKVQALLNADYSEFSKIKGLGKAKYAQLQACFELSRRAQLGAISDRSHIGR